MDVLGDAPPDRFAKAVEIVLKDKEVDAVLVILTPQAMTDPTATAQAVAKAAGAAHKPVLAAWMGGRVVAEGIQILNTAGIPTYNTPEKARPGVHAPGFLRPQPRNPARNAEGHSRWSSRSIGSGCAASSTRFSPKGARSSRRTSRRRSWKPTRFP